MIEQQLARYDTGNQATLVIIVLFGVKLYMVSAIHIRRNHFPINVPFEVYHSQGRKDVV